MHNPSAPVDTRIYPLVAVTVAGTIDSLRLVSELIQRFLVEGCGLSNEGSEGAVVVQTRLAIQEAVTNVLRHAYKGREAGVVSLELTRDATHVIARLQDDGIPFDPRRDGSGAMPNPEDLAEGGYGVGILEVVMNALEYSYLAGRGNELVMRKKVW